MRLIGVLFLVVGAVFLLQTFGYIYLDTGFVVAIVIIFLGILVLLKPSILKEITSSLKNLFKDVHTSDETVKQGFGFFSFRYMISTQLIKLIYLLGMLALIIGGIIIMLKGENEYIYTGILLIIVGNIIWRIICEGWILFFSIHDILGSINNELKKSN